MKKFILLLLLVSSKTVFAQTNYMDEIVSESCDCIEHISKELDSETYTMQLGLCMIKASMPYKKQLKKDHNINLDNIIKDAEKLGEVIGVQLALTCPEALMFATEQIEGTEDKDNEGMFIIGTITKVETEQFVVFTLKDGMGKSAKYYWIYGIETDEDLVAIYKDLIGEKVNLDYEMVDIFDPKIGEYRSCNVITAFAFVN
ncbi:MAG: hypothetical protein IPH74_07735 [Bacteroidetes bacterium]|nr:hypothetical protein [Bacteroidota bacterium]MBP7257700.1 hypothetical protein [Chitinophagales bacterium]MBK7138908.1 hypothetical protein [Bacteroidota bacterium]MBK7504037.1 hypothetical protein [Bacteroidota bacterium]MBK8674269.1 hypothetical protein [Bacteroidota bacterium]